MYKITVDIAPHKICNYNGSVKNAGIGRDVGDFIALRHVKYETGV